MNIPRWVVTLRCESPLHHGAFGEDTGNAVALRRIPLASAPQRAGIPVLSGNALRGALRRLVMRELFERCDLSRVTAGLSPKQWDKLYGALANGGHLTGSESRANPADRRALRDALPALSLFGAALYSYMLPGQMSVGWCYPTCTETVHAGLCAPIEGLRDADDLIVETALTRHIDRDWQDPSLSGVTPMPVTVEALIPGTVLTTTIIPMTRLTPEESGCLAHGMDLLSMIGGKTGAGFGRVQVTHPLDATPYEAWLADDAQIARARLALWKIAVESM